MKELTPDLKFLAITLICILSFTTSSAQSLRKYEKPENQTIFINGNDSVLRFQISERKPKHYNFNRTYYWYKNNSILKTTGGGDGRTLHGDYTCFFPDNNLKEKGKFKYGLKTGTWIIWYNNGKMKEISNWCRGLLHGNISTFDMEGNKISTEKYRNGKKIGDSYKLHN